MKMTKKLVLAAAALPLMFGTASAYAFGGDKGGHHKDFGGKCGGFDKKIMRQLDLTDAQKDQFKELRESTRAEMKEKHAGNMPEKMANMKAHQEKVQALVLADNFDEAAANELATEMVEKQTERRIAMLKKQHQMLSILTPEQKVQLKELQQERLAKCAEKMEKRAAKK